MREVICIAGFIALIALAAAVDLAYTTRQTDTHTRTDINDVGAGRREDATKQRQTIRNTVSAYVRRT